MKEENEYLKDTQHQEEVIEKFELMLKVKKKIYFDVSEFEDIIEHYIEVADYKKAFKAIRYGISLHPYSLEIQLRKAQMLIDEDEVDKALEILSFLERVNPSSFDIMLTSGLAYKMAGKHKTAEKKFKKVISLSDDDEQAAYYSIGIASINAKDFDTAIKYLEKAYRLDVDNQQILFELAFCYEKMNLNSKSIDLYENYLNNNPFSKNAWYNLGIAYNKIDEYEKAIEAYDFAIAIDPKYSSSVFNKANALANNDQNAQAIECYHEYLEFEDKDEQVLYYIGECYEKLDDHVNALVYFKKALDINDQFSDGWFGLASLLAYNERWNDSFTYINKAILLDGTNPDYWFFLGGICSKLNKLEDAKDAYRRSTELSPYDFKTWLNYSELMFRNHDFDEAISALQNGSKFNPGNADINYRLAAYYLEANNEDSALFHIKTGLSIDAGKLPDFLEYCPQADKNTMINNLLSDKKN